MKNHNSVGKKICILSNLIKRKMDEDASSIHSVTGVQSRILHFILARPQDQEIFQKHIEEEFNLRRSTATGILQLMEKNGLIIRKSVPYDARLKRIIITDKAADLKIQVLKNIHSLRHMLEKDISSEDLDTFFIVINQMIDNLEKEQN